MHVHINLRASLDRCDAEFVSGLWCHKPCAIPVALIGAFTAPQIDQWRAAGAIAPRIIFQWSFVGWCQGGV